MKGKNYLIKGKILKIIFKDNKMKIKLNMELSENNCRLIIKGLQLLDYTDFSNEDKLFYRDIIKLREIIKNVNNIGGY